jgi:uncharacterized membrane protein HdeD (DUF308 family)
VAACRNKEKCIMTANRPPDLAGTVIGGQKEFRAIGVVFAVLGLLAVLAPVVATVVVEQLVAWLLVFWGLAGLLFARGFRVMSEWRLIAWVFAAVLVAGLAFVFFPGRGAAFLTAIMVIVFLLDGTISILLGLRLRGQLQGWGWVLASGIAGFVLATIILVQWPTSSTWVLGFLTGLNFLSTGASMLLLSLRPGRPA